MNAHKERYLKELQSANDVIVQDGALIDYGDGSFGIDPTATRLGERFLSYYSGLLSAGYANGFI